MSLLPIVSVRESGIGCRCSGRENGRATGSPLRQTTAAGREYTSPALIAANVLRPVACGFFVDAFAGAAVLGETFLGDVAFLEHMGIAHRDVRRAQNLFYGGTALRTSGQLRIAEF